MTEKVEKGKGKGSEVSPWQIRRQAQLCMLLLTLQYGAQPLLTQHFSGKNVIMTSVVLSTELIKIFVAVAGLGWEGKLSTVKQEWSLADAVKGSALPATIYAVQNSLVQLAYRHLDSLTATMLNQTKLAFTALFMFLILGTVGSARQEAEVRGLRRVFLGELRKGSGQRQAEWRIQEMPWVNHMKRSERIFITVPYEAIIGSSYVVLPSHRQSKQQIGALVLLLVAATFLSLSQRSSRVTAVVYENSFILGVIPILIASVLSGLASSLCQWAVQVRKRSSYLMTIEMSGIGALCLIASLSQSPDGEAIRKKGFFSGWTPMTLVPVTSNAFGGILVGLVTMYAGGVAKGFVIVSALLVTALLQVIVDGVMPSWLVFAALPLVVSSTVIHQRYPYVSKKKAE